MVPLLVDALRPQPQARCASWCPVVALSPSYTTCPTGLNSTLTGVGCVGSRGRPLGWSLAFYVGIFPLSVDGSNTCTISIWVWNWAFHGRKASRSGERGGVPGQSIYLTGALVDAGPELYSYGVTGGHMQGLAGGSRPCTIIVTRRVPLTKRPMCQSNAVRMEERCGMAEQKRLQPWTSPANAEWREQGHLCVSIHTPDDEQPIKGQVGDKC